MNNKYKLKVAVIGLGHQSLEDHIPAVKFSDDLILEAVVETNKTKLISFLKENPSVKGYTNIYNLFKKHNLDFVIVAVPHNLHYKITKYALENNVHVLKEKPFAISFKEAESLEKIAHKKNLHIMTTLQRRFNPIYLTFFQLVDKIGKPFFIDIKYTFFTAKPYDGWRGKRKFAGGGCLFDMGYHMVDLLIWYFGLPDRVFAEMSTSAVENISYDAEDTSLVVFRYDKKDVWGSLLVSRVIQPKQESFDVYGTKGTLHIERGKISRLAPGGDIIESLERKNSWVSAPVDQLEYFVKLITGKTKEIIGDPKSHFNHLIFIEAAYKSKLKGTYIRIKK